MLTLSADMLDGDVPPATYSPTPMNPQPFPAANFAAPPAAGMKTVLNLSAPPTQPTTAPPRRQFGLILVAAAILLSGIAVAVVLALRDDKPKKTEPVANADPDKEKKKPDEPTPSVPTPPLFPPPPTGPVLADTTDHKPGLVKKMNGSGRLTMPVTFTPDGLRAVSRVGGTATGWDLVDYVPRPVQPWYVVSGSYHGLLVAAPDGKHLAATADTVVELYDGKTYAKENPPIGLFRQCTAITFTPDSKVVATAERDGSLGRLRFTGVQERDEARKPIELKEPVVSLSFSLDGRYLAASHGSLANMNIVNTGDKKIVVYRYEDGGIERVLEGHPKAVSAVAFFADGKRLFSASPYDGTLRVWKLEDGSEIKTIQAGASGTHLASFWEAKELNSMMTVAFWPWGRALTGHLDGSLVLWDLETGEKLRFKSPSEEAQKYATSLAISPDGHHALAAYNDNHLYLFRLPPPKPRD